MSVAAPDPARLSAIVEQGMELYVAPAPSRQRQSQQAVPKKPSPSPQGGPVWATAEVTHRSGSS